MPHAPSCTAGIQTAAADRDTWVPQSAPTNNFGTDSVLKVDSKSGGNARALGRCALPAIPAGCTVKSATLRMYFASYEEGRTLQVNRLLATWIEGAVNWNTQPSANGTNVFAQSRSSAGYAEWTVTARLRAG